MSRPKPSAPLAGSLAEAALWLLLLTAWWVHVPDAKDAFRLPKLVWSQTAVLASLAFLAWRLREVDRLELRRVLRMPAVAAVGPLVLVATAGLLTTEHSLHVRDALASFWIGAAALVGWSSGLPRESLARLVRGTVVPAAVLAFFGILQFHGIYRAFDFAGEQEAVRLGVTSFAGSAGDLAVLLVLPCLVAQREVFRRRGIQRVLWGGAFVLSAYGLVATQTLTAVAALAVGSLLLWGMVLPRRKLLLLFGGAAAVATAAFLAVEPLRERVVSKSRQLAQGSLNSVLTGRLDGWRTALYMLGEHPLAGVGHGAYRAEFAHARLALTDRGVEFFEGQKDVMFVNAHNEYLEVAAETGLAGSLALAWGLWVVVSHLRRKHRATPEARDAGAAAERALEWAAVAALAVLCLAQFPFRLALTAYPALLVLAWILTPEPTASSGEERR